MKNLGLGVAAVVQVVVLIMLVSQRSQIGKEPTDALSPRGLRVGDTLEIVVGTLLTSGGEPAHAQGGYYLKRSDGRWTTLLAFTAECRYCDSVGPLWRTWSRRHGSSNVVGITNDEPAVAHHFTNQYGISWVVLSLAGLPRDAVERAIAGRTPWIYLFDGMGVLRFEGHGRLTASIDSLLMSEAERSTGLW